MSNLTVNARPLWKDHGNEPLVEVQIVPGDVLAFVGSDNAAAAALHCGPRVGCIPVQNAFSLTARF